MKQYKNIISIAVVALVFVSLTLTAWFLPKKDFSDSERRKLEQLPTMSLETITNGSFMTKFESFTQDQFPLRDTFRSLKAFTAYYALGQLDNNGIYIRDGYAAKIEYPLHEDSVTHAADRFAYVYNQYLKETGSKIYFTVAPDKGYFLAEESNYLHMDYENLFALMKERMDFAEYIDITGTLDITDYYKTDTHWRQEKILETAKKLAEAMGIEYSEHYTEHALENPFYGVYYGQASLPLPAETIYYLRSDTLDHCIVTNHENGTIGGIYNMDKATGKDPYEMFLSGPVSLITIENPSCKTAKELIMFRDSFGSSIAPLLAEGYEKITLVDIRYLRVDQLDKFIEFDGQDVLFLYSTHILNESGLLT